jgi:hypothetical protein
MDSVTFARQGEANLCRLVKRKHPEDAGDSA